MDFPAGDSMRLLASLMQLDKPSEFTPLVHSEIRCLGGLPVEPHTSGIALVHEA
jgi:hypothetical protein